MNTRASSAYFGDYLVGRQVIGTMAITVGVLLLGCYPIVGTSTIVLGVPSTPVSISYRVVYLLFSIYILVSTLPRLKSVRIPVAAILLTLFWLVYLGRLIYDFEVLGLTRGYARKGLPFFVAYGIGGCFIPALTLSLVKDQLDFNKLRNFSRYAFIVSCLFVLLYIKSEIGLDITTFYQRVRLGEDDVINPIGMSQLGGGLFILVLIEKVIYNRGGFWILAQGLLGVMLLLMGGSRGPLMGVVAVMLLLAYQAFRWGNTKLKYWLQIVVSLAVGITAVALFILPNLQSFALYNRINSTVEKGAGLDIRGKQWSSAWSQFTDNPILGDQIIENAMNFYPHNFFLEVLMSTGIIGGGLVLALLGIVVYKYINRHRIEIEKWWIFYFMVLYLCYAFFSQALITQTHLWLLLTLAASLRLKSSISAR